MQPKKSKPTQSAEAPRQGGVQSLSRGLLLLRTIANAGNAGISLMDLAAQAKLAGSTTHRLLGTLESAGFVRRDPELGLWYVGLDAFSIGNAFLAGRDLVTLGHPHMHRLMREAGETVNLAILDDGEVVYIAQVECTEMMRMIVRLGSRVAAHASAVGKAIMANMPPADVEAIIQRHGLSAFTEHTITTRKSLLENLSEVRRLGYSCDIEEHVIGLHCVASAIVNERGQTVAALSLSGPKARMTSERLPALGAMITRYANHISSELGGTAGLGQPRFSTPVE